MKSKYSMFFILRKDIPMTSGMKTVHVADLAMNLFEEADNQYNSISVLKWDRGKRRKIVLVAKDLDELMTIYTKTRLVDHDGLQVVLRTTAYDNNTSKETIVGIGIFGKTSKVRRITNKLELL